MVENKNQHFVPEFYFNFFSEDEKTIRGYNLKSKKHYKGPFSNQASKNYFYGENTEIEKSFSQIEGKFKSVLKNIIESNSFLKIKELDYLEMLRFISFQHNRTEYSKKQTEDFIDKLYDNAIKPLMKSNKELMSKVSEEDINNTKIIYPEGFLIGTLYALESNILLTDLVPILILNETNKEFVFSDNPIVFYNLIYRDSGHSFEGIQSPGLLVFCPISPKHCIFLYDPEYYDIKCERDNSLILKSEKDIYNVNKLQFHKSLSNIYYGNGKEEDEIDKLSKEFFSKYSKDNDLSQMKEVRNWNGTNNSLLVSSGTGIPEKLNFNFLFCGKLKRKTAVRRNIKLCEMLGEKLKRYNLNRKL
jgi:hypothetical protein